MTTTQTREPAGTAPTTAGSLPHRKLKPCGTDAAYQRHIYRGEPVDDACEQAHRAANRGWEAVARTRPVNLPPCTAYGCPRTTRQGAHGWCSACYNRWLDAGQPEDGPPPRGTRQARAAQRREDYFWLRRHGQPRAAAARRVGVAERTAENWETARRKEVAA